MKIIKLGEIAKIDISNVDKKTKETDSPVILCNFVDVYHNWAITNDLLPNLMKSTANDNQISRFSIHKGQVAITKDSETRDDIGVSTYFADNIPNCVLGYHCALITPDENVLTGKYLNVVLHTPYAQKYFESNASGSGQRYTLTVDIIAGFPVPVPDIEMQHIVGNFYSAIDKKLFNNNRINAELEAMAKTIYDYWFTQFDFPDENGKPYKFSGGKMVWNEELKREIPEGWGDTTLNRYIGRITNGLNPRKNFILGFGQNYYVTIKSLTGNDINWEACDRCDDVALSKINARSQLQVGDVIFSAIGTIGRTFYIQEPPVNWNISETSFTVRPNKDVPADFFYALLNNDEIQIQADKKAMGSTLRCLVMDSFTTIPYIEIPCAIMQKFANVVKPMYNAIYKNNKQNRELTSIRDWLLPILMNGQVGFKEKTK